MTIRVGGGGGMRNRQSDIFTDLLFNILLGVMMLFLIALVYIQPEKPSGKIDLDAQYVITITWPDNNPDDVDTWVQDPTGDVAWFKRKNVGLLHLDRDDRGMREDTMQIGGQTVQNPLNQEITTIRGVVPGDYTVNVHYYETDTKEPVEVSVRLARVNPVYEIVYYGKVVLTQKGSEETAVRFTIAPDGRITDVNRLPKSLVAFINPEK
ncbi:MAG: hypothetical protein NW215_08865 [Hyphomicrobiales bacterium]|nr:hypothetical protein [Hyphomicrobiales bacterium]